MVSVLDSSVVNGGFHPQVDCIGGVMASVLDSSVVNGHWWVSSAS